MMYILDDSGYIEEFSPYHIACNNKSCTEYTGTTPEGYESLEEWATKANIRAYKIVGGNLTYDANREAQLQAENKEWKDLTPIVGTWTYLQYRRVGNQVFLRGHATSYAYSDSAKIIANMPAEVALPEGRIYYFYGFLAGGRISRLGVNYLGQIFCDWARNISDGSVYSNSTWHKFDYNYFLD